jgi:hypothetical protein
MKSRSRIKKASLEGMATGTVLSPLFAVSLASQQNENQNGIPKGNTTAEMD